MDAAGAHSFKDFMLLYNVMTETCFGYCVNNFNTRKLCDDELSCAEKCAGKYINYMNKVMTCYVDAQQNIVMKRISEAEAAQQLAASSVAE